MSSETRSEGSSEISASVPTPGRLVPGQRLAGRYQIVAARGRFPFGEIYQAQDQQNGTSVLVKLLYAQLIADAQVRGRLEQQILVATQLDHKNILRTFSFHVDPANAFLVTEEPDGPSLREMLKKKRDTSRAFSLKGAYNAIAHAANALTYAHGVLVHGTLDLTSIWVSPAGRVKVGNFGFIHAVRAAREASTSTWWPTVAPELWLDPERVDRRADVFSLGAMLFELLGGRPPEQPGEHLSDLVPGIPPALDRFLARCLDPSPAQRFADAQELKEALHLAIEKYLPTAGSPRTPAAAPAIKPATVSAAATAPPSIRSTPLMTVDDSRERWLVQKDRLDFGPYRLSEIQQQIRKGQIFGEHTIIDMDNGQQQRVDEHPLLRELAIECAPLLEAERLLAQDEAERRSRGRKNTLLLAIIAGTVVLGGGGLAAYLLAHQPRELTKIVYRDRDNEDLLKGIEITMKVDPPAVRAPKRHQGKKGSAGEYSDATNLGDVTEEGGDETLSQTAVQQVMGRSFGLLKGCVLEERRRNPGLKNVDMDFVIKGSGQVAGVRVNGSSATPFASCMYGKMQTVAFPKFNGAKTHASFSLLLK